MYMHVACSNSGDVQLHLVTYSGQYQRTSTAHLEKKKETQNLSLHNNASLWVSTIIAVIMVVVSLRNYM
jgi:hypothetical protein